MSPSKLKSSERQAARDHKASAQAAAAAGAAYNPSSGTVHTLQPLNSDTGAGYLNGRFKSVDDTDDNASSNGSGADTDCASNNGSCSGESEDQLHLNGKDRSGSGKPGTRGIDKRDKVRGKNERKHQRQKERRAQDLREKSTAYLMSHKLEALAQKLVAMGFPQDRATLALMINDGRVEQSVAMLLEGIEGQANEEWNAGSIPKMDISEELEQLLEVEKKLKLARPDVERAVVACEGDVVKAVEFLCARDRCSSTTACKGEHSSRSRPLAGTMESTASVPTLLQNPAGHPVPQPLHPDGSPPVASSEGKTHASSLSLRCSLEASSRGHFHNRKHPHSDPVGQGTFPSVSVKSLCHVSPLSFTPNVESGLVFGFGTPDPRLISALSKDCAQDGPLKDLAHSRAVSKPIMAPKNHTISSPEVSPSSWSHGFSEGGSPSSVLNVNAPHRGMGWKGTNASEKLMESLELGFSGYPHQISPLVSMQANLSGSQWNGQGNTLPNGVSRAPSSNTVVAHCGSPTGTSYGLFTGWGIQLPQSSVDWSSGPPQMCDYRKIDWSMSASPAAVQGISGRSSSLMLEEGSSNQGSFQGEGRFQTTSTGAYLPTDSCNRQCVWNAALTLQGGRQTETGHEWTPPFTGKALFSLTQAVSSPPL